VPNEIVHSKSALILTSNAFVLLSSINVVFLKGLSTELGLHVFLSSKKKR